MNTTDKKSTLIARRAELTQHIEQVEDALEEPVSQDWEDRSVERQGDEVLEALGQSDQAEVLRIDAALARIEAGTYGVCQKCGEDVSPERLELLPATPFCKTCAV